MAEDKTFYTATMAGLLAKQGKLEEAARIYRYLLAKDPQQTDLSSALDAVVARMAAEGPSWNRVAGTVERWVRLLIAQKTLACLGKTRIGKGSP